LISLLLLVSLLLVSLMLLLLVSLLIMIPLRTVGISSVAPAPVGVWAAPNVARIPAAIVGGELAVAAAVGRFTASHADHNDQCQMPHISTVFSREEHPPLSSQKYDRAHETETHAGEDQHSAASYHGDRQRDAGGDDPELAQC
jgi:uncharacterized integral membrane protein